VHPKQAQQYLKNQIMTAPKEQLLLMLFDGAMRFAEQAKGKLADKSYEESCGLLIRAQRIMIELVTSLDKNVLPEDIYNNLVRLYNFVYFRLIDANLKKEVERIDEALRILASLRATWAEAIEQERRRKFPEIDRIEQAEAARKSIEMKG
jgi:flagellar protein FliS